MLGYMVLHAGVNAASVAEAALLMILMLARRVPEQLQTFAQRGLGHPFGMQLLGKTLGIIGMGAIGAPPCLQSFAWSPSHCYLCVFLQRLGCHCLLATSQDIPWMVMGFGTLLSSLLRCALRSAP